MCLFTVAQWLWHLPHAAVQLCVVAVAVVLLPLRRRRPGAVLLVLAVLAGAAPVVGPVTAAAAYAGALTRCGHATGSGCSAVRAC
ncbi:hypothetical protein [Streptomyces sp. NPDC001933]|uniref:hypothetical protein n=1 Tax=Streptomyces sp. NPDC001933 TaxID=3364626 RepID=UPI00368F14B4